MIKSSLYSEKEGMIYISAPLIGCGLLGLGSNSEKIKALDL
jgi:hypothetical protein